MAKAFVFRDLYLYLYISFRNFTLLCFALLLPPTPLSLNSTHIMLSIKSSLASVLLLATYATAVSQSAPGQSAINLKVQYCSEENTGSASAKGTSILIS